MTENILSEIYNTILGFRWNVLNSNQMIWRIPYFRLCLFFVFYLTSSISKGFEVARRAENIWSYEYWVNNTCIIKKYHNMGGCANNATFIMYRNVKYIKIMLNILLENYCLKTEMKNGLGKVFISIRNCLNCCCNI